MSTWTSFVWAASSLMRGAQRAAAPLPGTGRGVIIPAAPRAGERYRQEYYACKAEVVSLDASVAVPAGSHTGCLQTREFIWERK